MLTIVVDNQEVMAMIQAMPRKASRSLELAIDKTARMVRDAVKAQMPIVFSNPTPYTMNSLQLRLTQGHNFQARVWFKTPDRMGAHYLVPEVEGGPRQTKGFELALGGKQYFPTRLAGELGLINQYGNIPGNIIRQMLSVIGTATAAPTPRSRGRNRAIKDYVWLPYPKNGLPAGIYERYTTDRLVSGKFSMISGHRKHKRPGFGQWALGQQRAIRARGLRPILLLSNVSLKYQPRLPFYRIGNQVIAENLSPQFWQQFLR